MSRSVKKPQQPETPEAVIAPRRGRAAAVGSDAGNAAASAFARAGFRDPALVLRWREIAGPEVARLAQPLKFAEGPSGGTLTLRALPGAALFLAHEKRALCERINAYLGRQAVVQIKFSQGALSPRPPPQPKQKPAGPCRLLAEQFNHIEHLATLVFGIVEPSEG